MHFYLPLLLLVLLTACDGNTAARKAARGENFVAAPNHIFFKNTRARHYRAEEIAERATIYRHDNLFDSDARLRPALIDNWLQDRALIRFETDPVTAGWQLEAGTDTGWAVVPLTVPPSNQELTHLSEQLGSRAGLRLVTARDTLTAFPTEASRKEARLVITDYLRLVEN